MANGRLPWRDLLAPQASAINSGRQFQAPALRSRRLNHAKLPQICSTLGTISRTQHVLSLANEKQYKVGTSSEEAKFTLRTSKMIL